MKKYLAGLICCLVLIVSLSFTTPAHATDWTLPFSNLDAIAELIQTILSGGEVSFQEISTSLPIIGQVVDYLYEEQAAYKRGALTIKSWSDAIYNELVRLSKEGYTNIDSNCNLVIPVRAEDLAAFMRYDKDWYKYSSDSSDSLIENPDVNYISYLESINGHGIKQFFWYSGGGVLSPNYPNVGFFGSSPSNYSWCYINGGTGRGNSIIYSPNGSATDTYTNYYVYPMPISNVYINGSGNSYVCAFQQNITPGLFKASNYGHVGETVNGGSFEYSYVSQTWVGGNSNANASSFSFNISGSLEYIFNYINEHMRNVNIYVNGELWDYVGTIPKDFITAPDVIQVGDTGLESYDVYPITDYDTLGFDVIAFLDWLHNHDFENDDTISADDLISDGVGVIVDRDGTTRALDDDDAIPVEKVIVKELDVPADPVPTGSPTPTPTPEIDDFPWIKFPIPPVPYQPNEEDTILSEIIEATDTVVPEPLMNVIWLCFALLVTGGLIEILHK